jgi:hypothetical protein
LRGHAGVVVVAVSLAHTQAVDIPVTVGIADVVATALVLFDTAIDRARCHIRTSDGWTRATTKFHVALLDAVAVHAIGTLGVIRHDVAAPIWSAFIEGASDAVITLPIIEAWFSADHARIVLRTSVGYARVGRARSGILWNERGVDSAIAAGRDPQQPQRPAGSSPFHSNFVSSCARRVAKVTISTISA